MATGRGRKAAAPVCHKPRLPAWSLLILTWPTAAFAVTHFSPYAVGGSTYHSNVFYFSGDDEAAVFTGDDKLDDRIVHYGAGIDAAYEWGQQKLHASGLVKQLDYDHFEALDHDEYLFDLGLAWKLGTAVDGSIDYDQEERMAPFAERNSTELALETAREGAAKFNFAVTPEWRVETALTASELESPLPEFPDFVLEEKAAGLAVKYLGTGLTTWGVAGEFGEGEFRGVPEGGRFDQTKLELTLEYAVPDLTGVGARAGATRREADVGDPRTEFTGAVGYFRQLSAKTVVKAGVFRRVESFVGGPSAVLETGAELELNWQASEKTSVFAAYEYAHGEFQQAFVDSPGDRIDKTQTAVLNLEYRALPWLTLRPNLRHQRRESNVDLESHRASIAGIELEIRFGAHAD